MYKLSERSLKRMEGIDSRLQEIAKEAIKITVVDFGVPEFGGKRTTDQQKALYNSGLSNADGVVALSYHQTGEAVDFYAIDPKTNKSSWNHELLAMVAAAFLQAACNIGYSVAWGGLWKTFKDFPHIQIARQ